MDIIVDGITKTYGRQNAVDELSFQVKTGAVLGFLGPNGAGKTLTLKAKYLYLQNNAILQRLLYPAFGFTGS